MLLQTQYIIIIFSPLMSSAEFLSGRGWKGLERRLGEGGVVSAAEGKRGVASAYSHENFLL